MKLQMFDYKQISTKNFIIKQKLSEVISQGSSGSVVKDEVLGMEVPGSNSGKFFSNIFCAPF